MKCIDFLKELLLYIATGIITFVVNTALYFLLYEKIEITNILSTIIAWFVAGMVAFTTNEKIVFKTKNKPSFNMISNFFLCRIATGILEVAIMYLFVDLLRKQPMLVKVCSNVFVVLTNYYLSKFFIFKK